MANILHRFVVPFSLSSPFIDPFSACGFFDIIIGLFVEAEVSTGKIIGLLRYSSDAAQSTNQACSVLDEAHKVMPKSSSYFIRVTYQAEFPVPQRHGPFFATHRLFTQHNPPTTSFERPRRHFDPRADSSTTEVPRTKLFHYCTSLFISEVAATFS